MSKNSKRAHIYYSLLQCAYWFGGCIVISFSAVYLKGIGLNNTQVGVVTALGDIGGLIVITLSSHYIDRKKGASVFVISEGTLAILAASLIFLLISKNALLSAACYILCITSSELLNSTNTNIYITLGQSGLPVNFGFSRGLGSLSYAASSAIAGRAAESFFVTALPVLAIFYTLLQAVPVIILHMALRPKAVSQASAQEERALSLRSFLSSNWDFCLLLTGIAFIFAANNPLSTFTVNIVGNVGGRTADIGYLLSFVGLIEIPAMLLFKSLKKRFGVSRILVFAVLSFLLKISAITLAHSVRQLFLAFSLHAISFGLYTPAIVDYIYEIIPEKDAAKGQSLAAAMVTGSSIVCKPLLGLLYDAVPVRQVLLVTTGIMTVGITLFLAGIRSASVKGKNCF